MSRPRVPHLRRGSRGELTAGRAWVHFAVLSLVLGGAVAAIGVSSASPATDGVPSTLTINVSISATASTFAFAPNAFYVTPGASVHLRITQMASYNHTFTLSSVANTTVPSLGWFSTHTPLVNVSLGKTAGVVTLVNFTAPALGTYEFVCEVHFPTMTGTMTSSFTRPAPVPPPGGGVLLEVGAAVVVLAVVVAGVWGFVRRRRPPAPIESEPKYE